MIVVTIVCVVAVGLMLAITVLAAITAPTCPDCGGVLILGGVVRTSKSYRCSHCKKWWWGYQIERR
jgi:predicted RNA-binding Zn-ribbon protein involved in translation (DUF1610 family)